MLIGRISALRALAAFAVASTSLLPACKDARAPEPCAPTAAGAAATREPTGPVKHVVLVTLDGLLPDAYLHPDAHGLKVPTLRRLVREGAASDGAMSVFPSVTYPSHTSMVTGVFPGKHGIVANRSFDPTDEDMEGWRWYAEDIKVDPVWRLAERAGYPTAMVHWPVSVGARVSWIVPEYWRAKNDNDRKVLRAVSTPGLLEAVAKEHTDFWPRYPPPNVKDDALTDIAIHLLEQKKPTLLLLHLVEVDGEQHHDGVWSEKAKRAIETDDAQLARLFDALARTGLAKDTNVIVASDHGFMDAPAMVKPCVRLREAGLVTTDGNRVTDWRATVVGSSGQAYVYLRDPKDAQVKAKVETVLKDMTASGATGIGRVYDAQAIRALGGDPEAFAALEAAPGYQLGGGCTGDFNAPPAYHATHGYDPNRPEMRTSLIVTGPGIPHGTLTKARLVDIGPTIAQWLGLAMPNVDGKPLEIVPAR